MTVGLELLADSPLADVTSNAFPFHARIPHGKNTHYKGCTCNSYEHNEYLAFPSVFSIFLRAPPPPCAPPTTRNLVPDVHTWHPQLVVASPPKANSQAEKLGVKKGDLVSTINGLNVVNMDSFEVTDYLAKYQVSTREGLRRAQ